MNRDDLIELIKFKNIKEIADIFKVSRATVGRWILKCNLSCKKIRYPIDFLNIYQSDVITGCLLGDGHIHKHDPKTHQYPMFQFGQKENRKQYVQYVRDVLLPLSHDLILNKDKKVIRIDGKIIHVDNDFHYSWRFATTHHEIFEKLREKWYPKGVKIVPRDLILNETILSHWYMDDGNNNQFKKEITFSTCSFILEDVEFLKFVLNRDYKFNPTITINNRNQPILHIGAREYFSFVDIVKEYVSKFECFKYKVDTSLVKETKLGYGASKLSMEKAKEIRKLYNTGNYTYEELAKMYGVIGTSIGNVINNKTYKKADFTYSGEANISLKLL